MHYCVMDLDKMNSAFVQPFFLFLLWSRPRFFASVQRALGLSKVFLLAAELGS